MTLMLTLFLQNNNSFCIALTKGEECNMLTVECVNNPYNQLINQMSTVHINMCNILIWYIICL